jgi:hypothetical protein
MSRLQKKPPAHKRGHPTLQNMNFFYFCGSFLPSWIRIRIRIQITDPDPDPMVRLNSDPIRIRIRNPDLKATCETCPIFCYFLNPLGSLASVRGWGWGWGEGVLMCIFCGSDQNAGFEKNNSSCRLFGAFGSG